MALRWLEGFENRRSGTYFTRLYASQTGGSSFSSPGRKALTGNALTGSTSIFTTKALVGSVQNTWIVGFALRKTDYTAITNGSCNAGIRLQNSVGDQIHLLVQQGTLAGSMKIEVRRGATILATSSRDFSPGNDVKGWLYFQFKVTIHPTLGSYELRYYDINGNMTVVAQDSSGTANTANQGTAGADRLQFRNDTGGVTLLMDDIIAMDSTGTSNNDFKTKPVKVVGKLPNADGTTVAWEITTGSTHFDKVDDTAATPNDTSDDYVYSITVGQVDLWNYVDYTEISATTTIIGMQVNTSGNMANSGQRTVRPRFRSGGVEAVGTGKVYNDLIAKTEPECFDVNPVTSAGFTKSELDAIQIGVEVQA